MLSKLMLSVVLVSGGLKVGMEIIRYGVRLELLCLCWLVALRHPNRLGTRAICEITRREYLLRLFQGNMMSQPNTFDVVQGRC